MHALADAVEDPYDPEAGIQLATLIVENMGTPKSVKCRQQIDSLILEKLLIPQHLGEKNLQLEEWKKSLNALVLNGKL